MSKKISRRNFIKGAAAGAVSVAAFGLVGCTQQTTQTPDPTPAPPEAPSPASNPVQNVITPQNAGAYLNPQDYNYTSNSITDFSKPLYSLIGSWAH